MYCGLPRREVTFPNKRNGGVLLCHVKAALQTGALVHGENGAAKQQVFRLKSHPSIHHYRRPPRLTVGTEVLQGKKIIKWDSNGPFWNGVGITLWSSWAASCFWHCGEPESSWLPALMLEEEEAVGAFGKECTGQTGITSLHYPLSSYCLSVSGCVIFAVTPGLRLNMRHLSSLPCRNWLPGLYDIV